MGFANRTKPTNKRQWRVGDRTWHVEWCASIPLDANGDGDLDRGDYRCEIFLDKDKAMARANEVLPLDAFSVVQVTEHEFVPYDEDDARRYPHAGYWDARGETIHVENT